MTQQNILVAYRYKAWIFQKFCACLFTESISYQKISISVHYKKFTGKRAEHFDDSSRMLSRVVIPYPRFEEIT